MFFTLFFTTSEHEHLLISFVCSIVTHFLPLGSSMRATWSQECSALAVQIFFYLFLSAFGANSLYLLLLAFS